MVGGIGREARDGESIRHFWNLATWPFCAHLSRQVLVPSSTPHHQSRGGGCQRLDARIIPAFAWWIFQQYVCIPLMVQTADSPLGFIRRCLQKTHPALKHGWRSNKIKSTVGDRCETWEESLLFLWTAEETAVRWPSTFKTPNPEGPLVYIHMRKKPNTKKRFLYWKKNPLMFVQILRFFPFQ